MSIKNLRGKTEKIFTTEITEATENTEITEILKGRNSQMGQNNG